MSDHEHDGTSELHLEPVRFIARVDAVLRLGAMMLGAGASSARVRAVMSRVAVALGIDRLDIRVGMTEIVVTAQRAGLYRTRVAEVRPAVDAMKITALKRLSHDVTTETTVEQLQQRLDEIAAAGPRYPLLVRALAAGAACAAFAVLLNGGWADAVAVGVAAAIGQLIRMMLMRSGLNEFLVVFLAAVASLVSFLGGTALLDLLGAPSSGHDTVLTAAVLFLVPGFPLVTGALDLARLDLAAGINRVVYAALVLLATGTAVWAVAAIVRASATATAAPLIDEPILTAARLVAGFVGVLGFALLFSTPFAVAATAAAIGTVANAGRLLLTDAHVEAGVAALAAAFTVGIIASFVSDPLRAARVTLTVPAVLIMVPGAATYQAIAATIEGDTLAAVQQAFEAVFVVVALAAGLTVARVLTEREWNRAR
ncbi:threonine/serine exporter family protein [Microbacter sp. GSS18]|nr:threonine/serine exporter family protein [Microbacter sp. GSS18]